jgi:hypothetical protein
MYKGCGGWVFFDDTDEAEEVGVMDDEEGIGRSQAVTSPRLYYKRACT